MIEFSDYILTYRFMQKGYTGYQISCPNGKKDTFQIEAKRILEDSDKYGHSYYEVMYFQQRQYNCVQIEPLTGDLDWYSNRLNSKPMLITIKPA